MVATAVLISLCQLAWFSCTAVACRRRHRCQHQCPWSPPPLSIPSPPQGTLKSAYEVSRLAAAGKDTSRSLGAAIGYWKAIEAVVASANPASATRVNGALNMGTKPRATAYTQVRPGRGSRNSLSEGVVGTSSSSAPGPGLRQKK